MASFQLPQVQVNGALDSTPYIAPLFTRSPVTSASHSVRSLSRTGESDDKVRVRERRQGRIPP